MSIRRPCNSLSYVTCFKNLGRKWCKSDWRRVSLQKLIVVSRSEEIHRDWRNRKVQYRVHKGPPPASVLGRYRSTLHRHAVCWRSAFRRVRKIEKIHYLASSCLSVRPNGTTRFPLDGFSRNLIQWNLSKLTTDRSWNSGQHKQVVNLHKYVPK